MQPATTTTQIFDETAFLKAVENQNRERAKQIWDAIKDRPNSRQAALAFLDTITDHDKVEWIKNEIIVHSPVRSGHNITLSQMHVFSRMATEQVGGYIGLEKIMIKLGEDYFEPDLCFFNPMVSKSFKRRQTIFPVPDFIVEVLSPSTQRRDRGVKRDLYCKYGVQEYWMVDGEKRIVYQDLLRGGVYEQFIYTSEMELQSAVIGDLRLPVAALFDSSHPFKMWVSLAIHGEVELALEASIELLADKDKALENKDKTIKKQGKTIENQDKALQEKDKTIENQAKLIEQLRRQLGNKS